MLDFMRKITFVTLNYRLLCSLRQKLRLFRSFVQKLRLVRLFRLFRLLRFKFEQF